MKLKVIRGLLLTLFLASMLTLAFNIQPVKASETIYIRADGSVYPPTTPIYTADNITYVLTGEIYDSIVVQRTDIIMDGNGNTVQGSASWGSFVLTNVSNVTIKNTNIKGSEYGVLGCLSSNNKIYKNNVMGCIHDGIIFYNSSHNNIISENIVSANGWVGIRIAKNSNNNIILANNVTGNGNGVRLEEGSSSNIVSGNNITNNYHGIGLSSSNNFIYHNNFTSNIKNTHNLDPVVNVWDDSYPSGGNYWSDYNGTDLYPVQNATGIYPPDGIGDTPYTIDANNADRYPLMGPISFFNACTWDETTYYVHTVSNSTISDFYFSREDKLIGFNVTGSDDTVGFCRVTIPNELLWCDNPGQWQVWVNNTLIKYRKVMRGTNCTYIYFTYNQSIQNIEVIGVHVIPEFPTVTSMLLILIVLTVAMAVYKRRLLKTSVH